MTFCTQVFVCKDIWVSDLTYRWVTTRRSRVSDFTYVLHVAFYNFRDLAGVSYSWNLQTQSLIAFPSRDIRCDLFRFSTSGRVVAQSLRCTRNMDATQSYPNLLSEKQAAKRLGIARITLLRARKAGRIRFFRIGARVLYCAEQLTEFLDGCERNRRKRGATLSSSRPGQEKLVSSGRASADDPDGARSQSKSGSQNKDQASLPFATSR